LVSVEYAVFQNILGHFEVVLTIIENGYYLVIR